MSRAKLVSAPIGACVAVLLLGGAGAAQAAPSCKVKPSVLEKVLHVRLVSKGVTTFAGERERTSTGFIEATEYRCLYEPPHKGQARSREHVTVSVTSPFPEELYVREEQAQREHAHSFTAVKGLASDKAYVYANGKGTESVAAAYASATRVTLEAVGLGSVAKTSSLLTAVIGHLSL
ncbi:MAG: hypothetical protein ACLPYW_15120 [Acidimicrobiales bacterium]